MPYTRVLIAAAVALIAATPSIGAQDTTRTDTTRRESRGDVAVVPTFERLVIVLDSTPTIIERLNATPNLVATNIRLIDVATLLEGKNADELHSALERNKATIDSLRAVIGTNAVITAALANPGTTVAVTPIPLANVIAAEVAPDGKVILFYYKRPDR